MSKTTLVGLAMASALASLTVAPAAPVPFNAPAKNLHYEKTFSLEAGNLQEIEFSAPTKKQKVSVTIAAMSAGVSAYLITTVNLEAVTAALVRRKEPAAELLLKGRRTKGEPETFTLEATIPAKVGYMLLLTNSKQTKVTIKVVGQ